MPKKDSHNTKNKIISAAWSLFYKYGFERTTVEDIIFLSSTSRGSFYHYFTKKDDLLVGLLWIIDEDLEKNTFPLSFGVDRPWYNPDSELLAAMGKEPVCGESKSFLKEIMK